MKIKLLYVGVFLLFAQNISSQEFSNEEKISLFKYAAEKYNEGDYLLTIEFCTRIINKSADAETFWLRAKAYRGKGDFENAGKDYSEAIQYHQRQYGKKDPNLSYDNALMYICLKRFDKALFELNEARRVYRLSGLENFLYLEEIGRVNHLMGDDKNAISNFKDAIKYGSSFANLELLISYFNSNNFFDLKAISDSLLSISNSWYMSDSCFNNYVHALNDIATGIIGNRSLIYIDNAIRNYRTTNTGCYQGFYYDMLSVRAFINSEIGNDNSSYEDYRKVYAANNWMKDIKIKVDKLKLKLGYDITPPIITLLTPQVNSENRARMSASKRKVSIYGQVNDSSGISSLTISANGRDIPIPVANIENDGIFEAKLELNPALNKVVISSMDKNENFTEKTYYIDFAEKETEKISINDSLSLEEIPEINTSVNYYAILIAEKDYEDDAFKDLANPANDAIELKEILIRYYDFKEENIKLMVNAPRAFILDTLNFLYMNLTEADNLIVFYAGHGDVKKINNRIEGGFIIPTDAKKGTRGSYISSEDLLEPVANSQAKHVFFIVDACFGGALMRSSMDDAPQNIKNLYNNKSRKVLTSGNLEEVPDNGLFISNVKKYLRTPGRKYVSGLDLYNYIVNNNNTPNTPLYERILNTGDAGIGQFILKRRD